MKPELVGKVRRDLQSAWTDSKDPGDGWWDFMARYAIALAERAAREAVRLTGRADYRGARIYSTAEILEAAVERAVEGT